LFLLSIAASLAAAVEPCPLTSIARVRSVESGLEVIEALTPSLQTGDVLVQLNDRALRTCSDLVSGLEESARRDLTALLLVSRGGKLKTLALPPGAEAPATSPPSVSASPTAVRVSGEDRQPLMEVLGLLKEFDSEIRLPILRAQPFVSDLDALMKRYQTLQASNPAVRLLDPAFEYYQSVATVLRYKEEKYEERQGRRPQPDLSFEYHSESEVDEWLQRYPFLRASVTREPRPVKLLFEGEAAGVWRPDEAIRLLVERARAEIENLERQIRAASQ
jgi:hypothetical protein